MEKDRKNIASGSVLKKTLLLAEHMAKHGMTGQSILTDDEIKTIVDSFKNDKELLQYDLYRKAYDRINTFLHRLTSYRLAYGETIHRLDKILSLKLAAHDIKNIYDAAKNSFKNQEDLKGFEQIINNNSNVEIFFYTLLDTDTYCKARDEWSSQIDLLKKKMEEDSVELKTAIEAYKGFVKETKFNIKTFTKFVDNLEKWAKLSKGTYLIHNINNLSGLGLSKEMLDTAKENGLIEDYESVPVNADKFHKIRKGFLYV